MATGTNNTISGIDLSGDKYVVEQGLIRTKYKATDADGNVVLRAKKKRFSIGEKFPFQDADGNDVFMVGSEFNLNTKRDYVMTDAGTDQEIALLDDKFSLLSQKWQIRDPDETLLATIETRSPLVALARGRMGVLGKLVPHQFDIKDADGNVIGGIDGQLSLNDVYEVTVDSDVGDLPRETIVAAAMVIDAIEGN